MEAIRFDNLTFTYPMSVSPVLNGISFAVDEAEFLVVCGKSGCGKSTLLRQIKRSLIPYGRRTGEVFYYGEPADQLDERRGASEIGFVQQNPDNQIVTDKVWHELAFGLESLGMEGTAIRRRVAEMASYFDIQGWFRRDVAQLSGGQKQLLNLASVMVMQPRLLVLDEPTSQLDPIAASEFLQTIRRVNRELGITVILSEHRLEEVFSMADRVMVMDQGDVLACGSPRRIGGQLARMEHPMFHGLSAVTKIYHAAEMKGTDGAEAASAESGNAPEKGAAPAAGEGPLTVREGRLWLRKRTEEAGLDAADATDLWEKVCGNRPQHFRKDRTGPAIRMKNVWFRYGRDGADVLRDLNLEVFPGQLYTLLGGNGAGKTTALKAALGLIAPRRGKVSVGGRIAMLPQNPQALFSEITVEEELLEALRGTDKTDEEMASTAVEMSERIEIRHLRRSHPYDLSGGEQQRLALGKVLLLEPEILLLDEPTKGLDPFFKLTLAGILKDLTSRGITILMVSHDIEFCARHADRCAMFFDGGVVSEGSPRSFFAGNSFYTTTANRMAREYFPDAVTWEEVAACVREMT